MLKLDIPRVITAGLFLVLGTSTSFQARADATTAALHDDHDDSNNCHICGHECYEMALVEAVSKGHFSHARWLAQQALHAGCGHPQRLAELFQQHANDWLDRNNRACYAYFVSSQQAGLSLQNRVQPSPMDEPDCWSLDVTESKIEDPLELWDECCSQVSLALDLAAKQSFCDVFFLNECHSGRQNPSDVLPTSNLPETCYRGQQQQRMCCDFRQGTSSYLRLPVLRELAIRLVVQTDDGTFETFDIEQDGFLRMYDTSVVMWPTGYLLSLCVAAPRRCGVPELYKAMESGAVVELGAGIAIPSTVLSHIHKHRLTASADSVFAADISRQGLMLTATNALTANTSVIPMFLNHSNITAVSEFRGQYAPQGFSIVLGSALQDMFHESTREKDDKLWNALDVLLAEDDEDVDDGHGSSIVVLSHTIHALQVPLDGVFERIRTISGDVFDMKTRWGASSDFEISVFQRRRPQRRQRQEQKKLPPTTATQDEL